MNDADDVLLPREIIASRDGTRGRLFQADGIKAAGIYVKCTTKLGGTVSNDPWPFLLVPGSVVVCKIDENGQFTATRMEGPGT